MNKKTVQNSKNFKSQSIATQARIGKQLVSIMTATKKLFDVMGDDIVELSTKKQIIEK